MAEPRKTVFISYAHKDRRWVDELVTVLAPWIRSKRVELWDDSRIQPGSMWLQEIERALDEATVAVMLVTPAFLASDFIMEREFPVLLERVRKKNMRLMWIAAEPSAYEATPLGQYQAVNNPSRPLASLTRTERQSELVDIAKAIADAVTIGTFAGSLEIIDETTEPIAAAVEKRPERADRDFRVQAVYEPRNDRISFTGSLTTITVADLAHLPPDDREFIADLDDSLVRNYQRWRDVRRGLGDAGGALDGEIQNQLTRIARLICADLNNILDFLRTMHKYDLEDHYGRYRFICQQLPAT
jgi:hypothetical protein